MSGEANRKIFFGDRNLGLSEGYQILLGGVPKVEDIHPNFDTPEKSEQIKRLLLLFRKERINEGALTVYDSMIVILTFAQSSQFYSKMSAVE